LGGQGSVNDMGCFPNGMHARKSSAFPIPEKAGKSSKAALSVFVHTTIY